MHAQGVGRAGTSLPHGQAILLPAFPMRIQCAVQIPTSVPLTSHHECVAPHPAVSCHESSHYKSATAYSLPNHESSPLIPILSYSALCHALSLPPIHSSQEVRVLP